MTTSSKSCTSTPIAIIGIGCRFSGDATSPEKLWQLLERGRSTWSKIPPSRFHVSGVYHPNGERIGSLLTPNDEKTHVKGGHFLDEDPALFDAPFFNMTTQVASSMDPQYRLMLEVVYEALESAGITIESIAGSNTAVFSGAMYRDYHDSLNRDLENLPRYFTTGNANTMASNRISHFYDLRGPSVTVDTACSTTLTALHLACQGLRACESDMAIVAGANLLLNPEVFMTMSNLGFLSPDGISYTFDPRANGYGRGEGVGAILLKALPGALRDHDPIRAVIRETALNQDGRTPTITTPSDVAQECLIRKCYSKASLDLSQTSYVEAHGTGTPTGDPLEVSAISAAFQGQSLYLSSVKANLGHTEAASGLASIIKVVLSLEKGLILPNARFLKPNSKLMLDKRNIKLPTSLQNWPLKDGTRRASINNFGFGGSNAHVILEGHNPTTLQQVKLQVSSNGIPEYEESGVGLKQVRIYVLSAKDEQACERMISNLRDYIEYANVSEEPSFLASLAYTLGSRRSILPWTAVCAADSLSSLVSALNGDRLWPKRAGEKIRVGWVFTGQGAQWHAMGRELLDAFPIFKETILECDSYVKEMGASWTILEELHRDEVTTHVNDAEYSLPLSTAIQIALVRLLWSWDIRPTGITSHSSGEAAAAYAAGVLSARSAMGITFVRGALTTKPKSASAKRGGMLAVGLGRSEANVYISRVNTKDGCLVVGCVNSPSSVTVSGDLSGIEKLEMLLNANNIFSRRLKVTEAFHSSHMQPMVDAFGASLAGLLKPDSNPEGNDKSISHFSSVVVYSSPKTGGRMHSFEPLLDCHHWMESMLHPVEFESSLREMCFDSNTKEQVVDVIVEIGPHAALGGPIKQIIHLPEFAGTEIAYISCLSRGKSSLDTMSHLATELMQKGYRLNMDVINFPRGKDTVEVKVLHDLPQYPWNHQTRYWGEPRSSRAAKQRKDPPHYLIGSPQPLSPFFAPIWKHVLRVSDVPWMRDHVVGSKIIFPGAGFICMAIEGISQKCQQSAGASVTYSLRDIELAQALILPADEEAEVDLRLTIFSCDKKSLGTKDWHKFSVHSISGENDTWIEHCTGLVRLENNQQANLDNSTQQMRDLVIYNRAVDPQDLWNSLRATGIHHGPLFQNILEIKSNRLSSFCTFTIANTASVMPNLYENRHTVHPTTIDSVIQAAYTALPSAGTRLRTALIPRRLKNMKISSSMSSLGAGQVLGVKASIKDQDSQSFSADLTVFGDPDDGISSSTPNPVIAVEGLVFQSLGGDVGSRGQESNDIGNTCSSWFWAPDITLVDFSSLRDRLSISAEHMEMDLMMDLRRCTIHFIQGAVEYLTIFDIEQLDGYVRKFYSWMNVQLKLTSENKLGEQSADWLSDDVEQRTSLRTRVIERSVNGEMISRLGSKLTQILRGEVDPLELMMEGKLLARYYVDAIKWSRSNRQASELVRLCAHKNPRSRILEIGAGTGGCTQLILTALGDNKPVERYDFTDVSAGFFESARERFRDWGDVMSFRKLDIEIDPEDQGFECGSYDLVVACQVLHATRSMNNTLSNVHKLLKPGGRLILVETTKDQLDLFFTFGLLPGWWLSEEAERQLTPSLSPDLWQTMLSANGFNGVELEVRDCDHEEFYMISTIMSTAKAETIVPNPNLQSDVILLHADSPPPLEWLKSLQSAISDKTGLCSSIKALNEADTAGKTCIFLGEMEQSLLGDMETDFFASITSTLGNCDAMLWVTRGATITSEQPWKALHLGLLRTLRNESHGKRYVSLDVDPSRDLWTPKTVDAICHVFNASLSKFSHKELEYAERDGVVLVPRAFCNWLRKNNEVTEATLEPFQQPNRQLRMDVEAPGLLDSLYFRDDDDDEDQSEDLPGEWVEIEPKAFGLNFRDIMVAMGQLETNRVMGFECAGVITRLGGVAADKQELKVGDRVCALLKGNWSTRTRTLCTNVARIPDEMSFVEAASIPVAFSTAYISLYSTANLRRGEKVLIHGGAGGVGQAAIILSQLAGAEVFVTAGTKAKRDFVRDKFRIPPDHIFSSRDASFIKNIQACTGGVGVDVVLNSLAGPLLQASFNCMADFGRFVEIGKRDLEQNSQLDMLAFTRNVSFSSIDLLSWQRSKAKEVSRALKRVMQLLEEERMALIAPISVYPISDIERAFRIMQSGQHVGKLVVTVAENDLVPVRRRRALLKLKAHASYLVVGGLGGIGRRICEWLIDHGARHLIILSRSATTNLFVASLEQRGCLVQLHSCDVSYENELASVLQRCAEKNMPPIRGVIQGAMVLQDAVFSRMTLADFNAAIRPKVHGSWHLHKMASDVDFFVMLSSLVGVMGGAGQANYAAAGAFQDALAHHRRSQAKPAVSIDLGMVKSVGYVAETGRGRGVAERLARIGYMAMHEEEVMEVLENAIMSSFSPLSSSSSSSACSSSSRSSSCPAAIITGINTSPGAHWAEADWLQEQRFVGLRYRAVQQSDLGVGSSQRRFNGPRDVLAQLSGAISHDAAVAIVVAEMTRKLMRMFGLAGDDISSSRSLAGIGVDSLVAIELRSWITSQLKVDVSVFELLDGQTIADLAEVVVRKFSQAKQR